MKWAFIGLAIYGFLQIPVGDLRMGKYLAKKIEKTWQTPAHWKDSLHNSWRKIRDKVSKVLD